MQNKAKQTKRPPQTILFAAAIALILIALIASICIGQYPISLHDIWRILTAGEVSDMCRKVFLTLRLPRAIMALIAGFGLGMAGNVYQTIFKNPLASPDIIGVASGANLGSAIAIVLLGGATVSILAGSFAGGIMVVLFVMLLVRATPTNTVTTYVLAGIVMSSISSAFIMILKFFADPANELAAIEFWTMGSFANVTADKLLTVLPVFLFSTIGIILLRRQIDLMSLNEDECRMLGVCLPRMRTVILALSTLLVASIISVTGLISFVGLIAPHITKMMLKRNNFATTMMSALVGGIILLVADMLARTIYTAEIPISILTTIIGVPLLVYFMCTRKGGYT